jgi:hypothetical protein
MTVFQRIRALLQKATKQHLEETRNRGPFVKVYDDGTFGMDMKRFRESDEYKRQIDILRKWEEGRIGFPDRTH